MKLYEIDHLRIDACHTQTHNIASKSKDERKKIQKIGWIRYFGWCGFILIIFLLCLLCLRVCVCDLLTMRQFFKGFEWFEDKLFYKLEKVIYGFSGDKFKFKSKTKRTERKRRNGKYS